MIQSSQVIKGKEIKISGRWYRCESVCPIKEREGSVERTQLLVDAGVFAIALFLSRSGKTFSGNLFLSGRVGALYEIE